MSSDVPVRQRKPGPKDAPEVAAARMDEMLAILEGTGWTKRLEARLAKEWNVTTRTVRRIKAKAVASIKVSVSPGELEAERAQHLSRTRAVFDLAVSLKDPKAAIAVLRHEALVIGLEKPRELVLSGGLRGLSDEDLARKEAEYAAAMGGEASS